MRARDWLIAAVFFVPATLYAASATRTSSFDYDPASGLLTKEVIEPGNSALCLVTTYAYGDAFGNKTGATTRNCNGSSGEALAPTGDAVIEARPSTTIYAAGTQTVGGTLSWSAGQFPTTSTNALNHSETKEFDPRFGAVTKLTGPNGLVTTWSYDSFGRKKLEVRSDGNKTEWAYFYCSSGIGTPSAACPGGLPNAQYFIESTPKGSTGAQNGPITKVYYDSLNREVRTETQGFDGAVLKDTYYDNLGRVAKVSRPYYSPSAVDCNATPSKCTLFTYDILGRVETETQPQADGKTIRTYTEYSGVATTGGQTITVKVGHVVAGALAPGGTGMPEGVIQTRTTRKNSQGQVDLVTDTQGNAISYTYDPFGNLLRTTAGGIVTEMTYDLRGRKETMREPNMVNWADTSNKWVYVYDALGQLKRQTDAKGQVVTMTYDLLGRMTSRTEPDLVSKWFYDAYPTGQPEWDASLLTNLTGDCSKGKGKLCYVWAANGYRRLLTYETGSTNAAARPLDSRTRIDADYTVKLRYDTNGRLDTTTYPVSPLNPTGFVVKNVYKPTLGYLEKVTNSAGTTIFWQANTVSATGKVLTETVGFVSGGYAGTSAARTYDELDRMTGNTVAGGNLQNFTYKYDTIGNLTQRVDVFQSPDVTESFVYDRLNRLKETIGTPFTPRTYTYSVTGNIATKGDVGTYNYNPQSTPCTAGQGGGPHAVCSITGTVNGFTNPTFAYDKNGNLTSGLGRTLTYTSFNMPLQLQGVNYAGGTSYTYTYTYNADHERTRLIHSTLGTFIYLHPAGKGQLLYEKEIKPGGPTEHKHYITAGALLVGVYISRSDATTAQRYFHHDHLGSLTLITNEAGGKVERFVYEAFGKRRVENWQDDPNNTVFGITTDRGFTSHEHLDEVALIHMNGRIYDPVLARFMTADPFVPGAGNLQAYNRYSYVLNNPLSYTDPTGYKPFWKKRWFRMAVVITVAIVVPQMVSEAIITSASNAAAAAGLGGGTTFSTAFATVGGTLEAGTLTGLGAFASGAAGGFAAGLVASNGNLEAAFKSGIAGGLSFGVANHFGSSYTLQRVAAESLVSGINSELSGGNFADGVKKGLTTSALAYINVQAREAMVEQSRLHSHNTTGVSVGLFGDSFKLGGTRLKEMVDGTLRKVEGIFAFGGVQGEQGSLFGFDYSPGSIRDRIAEAFAGPHDFFNYLTGTYNETGNARHFTGLRDFFSEAGNVTGALIVAPVAIGGLLRSEGIPVGFRY